MSSRCPHPRGPCARHCADLSGIRRVRSAARPPSLRCVVDVRPAIGRLLSFRSYPAYSVQFDAATHVVVYMSTTAIASTAGTFTPWGEHKATSLKRSPRHSFRPRRIDRVFGAAVALRLERPCRRGYRSAPRGAVLIETAAWARGRRTNQHDPRLLVRLLQRRDSWVNLFGCGGRALAA